MTRAALFLDRDGVVNRDTGYVHRIEDFVFQDGIFALCAAAQARGMAVVIVTNQAGIGRGYYTEADFVALTEWMRGEFARHGVRLTAVEHCPDHPTHGVGAYRRENPRRKPGPGMILDACAAYGIDPARSVMLGDRASDMAAAVGAGVGRLVLWPAEPKEVAAAPPGTIVLGPGGLLEAIGLLPEPGGAAGFSLASSDWR